MQNVTFITGNQSKADYLAKLLDRKISHRKVELDELQSTDLRVIVDHKARQAYTIVGTPVLVEDVALEFSALGNLPGTFIKFFVEADDGLEKLCRTLDGFNDRTAIARCTFGYFDGTEVRFFSGELRGAIADHPKGEGGFGWDKIFCPDGYAGKTRAELSADDDALTYQIIKPFDALRDFFNNDKET
jgi:inosine triphosphate pyrophosphatase